VASRADAHRAAYSFTLAEAVRTRAFWLPSFGNGLGGLAQSAVMVHLFLHLEQGIGLSRAAAALVWTVTSMVNIPSRLLVGILGDRLPKHLVLGTCMGMMGVGVLVLGLAQSMPAALVLAVLYGAGWGGRAPIQNSIQGEYWGLTSLGKITGMLHSFAVPLSIAGPVVAGVLADVQGDYRIVFLSFAVISLIGAGLTLLASQPKAPPPGP
jgi:MFS family permease